MPRCVRNFFATLSVDGRKTPVATGPRSKVGGLYILFNIREKGAVSSKFVNIACTENDGKLRITATQYTPTGEKRTITLVEGER